MPAEQEPLSQRWAAEGRDVVLLRCLGVAFAVMTGAIATLIFVDYAGAIQLNSFYWLAAALLGLCIAWLAWGAYLGVLGLAPMRRRYREVDHITARTVVLVPICNEDAVVTMARVAAMHRQMAHVPAQIDFAILSDTQDPLNAQAEEAALARLLAEHGGQGDGQGGGRIFYRRRHENSGRKAGNIADFIRTSGAAWDFALILDADSLMEAETVATMIRRMEAAPDLTLLQSLPQIVRARSVFGRAMQFSATCHGPVFTRGLARLQGRTGPYWGHNALVRIRAFAACCGLPELTGRAPSGGHILSHDYVEAALLARGGWTVRVDPDLQGSYEEAPENVVSHARRDRRWCQGNLQHARLLRTPGLRLWSRAVFVQGILSYLAPAAWALFLIAVMFAGLWQAAPDYLVGVVAIYTEGLGFKPMLLPDLPLDASRRAVILLVGVVCLLVLPKLLVLAEAIVTRRSRGHGGSLPTAGSVLAELLLSAVLAPVLMAFQVRSVVQVLCGQDGGWPPNARAEGKLTLAEAWAAAWFVTLAGGSALIFVSLLLPQQLVWLLPVLVPMLLAPVIISMTSHATGETALFATPQESARPDIVALHDAILARWQRDAALMQTAA